VFFLDDFLDDFSCLHGLGDLVGVKTCEFESAMGSIPSCQLESKQLLLHIKYDHIHTQTQANPY